MPVSTVFLGRGARLPASSWSNSMKTRFQISTQRDPPQSSSGRQSVRPHEHGPPRSQNTSLSYPHGP